MNKSWTSTYRAISLVMAIAFAAVGLLFLIAPGGVLRFFNELSVSFGLESSPVDGLNFYLILAVGYMYLVTLIAWFMYRRPENNLFPLLLMNAKLASALVSFVFFVVVSRTLIYAANAVIDGLIGTGAFLLYRRPRGSG